MPPSWRDGLVNAFPIPQDRVKLKKASKKEKEQTIAAAAASIADAADDTASAIVEDPFPFFDLAAEIRNRVYRLVLFSKSGYRGPEGRKKSRTSILAVSKRMHQEAAYILYSTLGFRIFPLQDFVPVPVIQELRPMYRAMVTKLEMVLGSSWTNPPKTWRVSKLLAKRLGRLSAVQTLKIFVELDPSLPMFAKYRVSLDFYTDFCGNLLREVLATMPHLEALELDGNPGVDAAGPLVSRLLAEVEGIGKPCTLGPTKQIVTRVGLTQVFWQ